MFTRHAEVRCQQRGIRQEVVQTLLVYGRQGHRHGAEVYFMDREARMRARAGLGKRSYAKVADRLNAYLVVADDGGIITEGSMRRYGCLCVASSLFLADVDCGDQAAGVDDAAGKGTADAAALVGIDASIAALERNRRDDRTDAAACEPAVFTICS